MYEFLLISLLAMLALLSHLARKHRPLEYIIRFIILSAGICEATISYAAANSSNNYIVFAFAIAANITIFLLFKSFRELISWLFTGLHLLLTGQVLLPLIRKKIKATEYFSQRKIFVPSSFPHLVALFVYTIAAVYVMTSNELEKLYPALSSLPDPLKVQNVLSCGGLAFMVFAFCGIGIFITRNNGEALKRLDLTQPNKFQIALGLFLIIASFIYDIYWIQYSCSPGKTADLATRLSYYKSTSFAIGGAFLPSIVLALAKTGFAGFGEEVLIRGALQPVFGILPSALLHALLHSQLNHAPRFILQVAIWSVFMGFIRRYSNTSTTIVTHVGLNLVTTLLYIVNP